MIITFSGKVCTETAEEQEVFKAMKEFMNDNFQDYDFSVSGKKETLRHEYHKSEEEPKEEIKQEEKETSQAIIR